MKRLCGYIVPLLAAGLLVAAGAGCAEAKTDEPAQDAVKHLEQSAQFAEWTAKGTVLVDFYADWCGPCRRMSPTLSVLSTEWKDKVTVVKVNVDKNGDLAQEYRVSSIPYLVLFRDGKIVDSRSGLQSLEQLRAWVQLSPNGGEDAL